MTDETPLLFAFGLGYSAMALARRVTARGWRVSGTCRSDEKAEALRARGIAAHVFDPGAGRVPPADIWADASHAVVSIAPDADGDPVVAHFGDALAAAGGLQWIAYLSTTGVYGDRGGAWVDESASTEPGLARAKRRVMAEQAWLALHREHGLPVHVFRLAGIYGPGRSALDAVRAGRARRIDRPGQLFSRIHVDDIAGALAASIERPSPGAVYNVCDDEPAAPADVTAYACELLGVEPPPLLPFDEAAKEMSPMGRSFWEDDRKVSNRKLREDLDLDLAHSTYRDGLRAILETERLFITTNGA